MRVLFSSRAKHDYLSDALDLCYLVGRGRASRSGGRS